MYGSVALFPKTLTTKIKTLSFSLHSSNCIRALNENESLITYICTQYCSFRNA
jgi:hypothetical protein